MGGVSDDSCAGVHDGVRGTTELTAWKPAPRLDLHVFDDNAMTVTGMSLGRPRSDTRTSDGLGNEGRDRVAAPGRAERAGAGARCGARVGASAQRVRGWGIGVAVQGGCAHADAHDKQDKKGVGREVASNTTQAMPRRAAACPSGILSTIMRSAGIPQPKHRAGADRGGAGPPRSVTEG